MAWWLTLWSKISWTQHNLYVPGEYVHINTYKTERWICNLTINLKTHLVPKENQGTQHFFTINICAEIGATASTLFSGSKDTGFWVTVHREEDVVHDLHTANMTCHTEYLHLSFLCSLFLLCFPCTKKELRPQIPADGGLHYEW